MLFERLKGDCAGADTDYVKVAISQDQVF